MSQIAGRAHIGAYVEAEQRRQLIELARSQDRSVSSVIRQALKAHVEREATAAEFGSDPERGEKS
jgi:predicted transcriptional regulator